MLPFDPDSYGPHVAAILTPEGGGTRPMELFPRHCSSETVRDLLLRADARELFPASRDPDAALSGLFLYFSCLKEAHDLIHRFASPDAAYWHGIMHRMEGDAYNAAYWFHRVPSHAVYPALAHEAAKLGYGSPDNWDPFAFIHFCEASARTGEANAKDRELACWVQLAEWQLLFDFCALPTQEAAN
jgi:hypothetical protein